MKIEDQVCSLELAKRLKKLKIKQESIFYYYDDRIVGGTYEVIMSNWEMYSAFTASELGNILPNAVQISDSEPFDNFRILITKFISVDEKLNQTNNFIVNYECDSTEIHGQNAWLSRKLTKNIYDPNLANAMAKMLIYLIENGLLKDKK